LTSWRRWEHKLVAAAGPKGLLRIRADQVVVSSGGLEQPIAFGNDDLPGVMLSGAVERLINQFRVLPGGHAVVVTGSARGYRTAKTLLDAGASVTLLDWRPDATGPEMEGAAKAGAVLHKDAIILRALGRNRLRGLVARIGGAEVRMVCDLVAVAGQVVPASGLLSQAGARMRYDEELMAFVPVELPEGIHAAGSVLGESEPGRSLLMGRLTGLAAAEAAVAADVGARHNMLAQLVGGAGRASVAIPPKLNAEGKSFACLCMDVTSKEMGFAVEEGFDSIELLKRYTTIGMGPCQGKSCLANCVRLAAGLTGRSIPGTGVPTARAPWLPVELGLLAAERFEPRMESPLHDCHADLGAEFMWSGTWRRPRQYREPAYECRAVHESVGIIDVSSLGKFRICGGEAVALLERLYPDRFGDLQVGRIRYTGGKEQLLEEVPFQSIDELLERRRGGDLLRYLLEKFAAFSGIFTATSSTAVKLDHSSIPSVPL